MAIAPHLDALRATIEDARFTLRGRWRPRKKSTTDQVGRRPRKELSVTVSMGGRAIGPPSHSRPGASSRPIGRSIAQKKRVGTG
ncbi:MAG TPA: hypothetical protein VJV04_16800 [Nitrospiraceae bacterium]|nr:hypothetical protein [Nitrospiraceae bacterium]